MGTSGSCCNSNVDAHNEAEMTSARQDMPGTNVDFRVSKADGGNTKLPSAPSVVAAADSTFDITLDKTGGKRLGIDVDHMNGVTLLIVEINGDGLFQDWNDKNPSCQVSKGDHIVTVNGKSGNVLDLVNESKVNQILKMVIKKGC
mmetsp:Transcript_26782/g.69754  ORF Transcript_26782/g.69754 Transcript_26782/m.69754 type:complete len:145 (+) Transcript_26782:115-549(+)